jgi:hypothetical protein
LPLESSGLASLDVIGRGECTSACLCRGRHRSIVALAQSLQLKGAISLKAAAKIVPGSE